MKSDRRLTDCMRLNLTCDPECERTVSHLQLPAPASCHRLPAGALAEFLLGRVRASMIRAGVNESTAGYYPLKRFKRAPWKRPAVLLGE